jgi:hypothetical protein
MRVLLQRTAVVLLAALVAAYAGDWLVYRYHAAHGNAFDSVTVNQFIAVPLKNGKYEIDYVGSQPQACVRTIFPWAGDDPCWWLRRHTDQGTQP